MIVPILARLYAMATADALGRVEKNAARLAVYEPAGGHQVAVLLSQSFNRTSGHELSFRVLLGNYQRSSITSSFNPSTLDPTALPFVYDPLPDRTSNEAFIMLSLR